MNSCQEEGVRDRNRAGSEAADPEESIPTRFWSRTPSSLHIFIARQIIGPP
eukprot:gene26325-biopygen15830